MSAARQPALFTTPFKTRPTRAPLMAPHATAEDMARPREVSLYLLPPSSRREGWACRPSSTPVSAMTSFLRHIERPAADLEPHPGADPEDIELRLTARAAGEGPLHILAIVTGLSLDETRKALAACARAGL